MADYGTSGQESSRSYHGENISGGNRQGPESQNASGASGDGGPGIGNEGGGGSRYNFGFRKGSGFQLPAGFENILLADGRTLGDLFGNFGRFGRDRDRGRRSGEVWARLMERRARANRLGFTKSMLTRLDGDANVRRPTLLEG